MATEKRLDLIDRNALVHKMFYVEEKQGGHGWVVSLEDISKAPQVDAVEVVRCKNCRYYEKAEYDEGYKMVCRLLKRQTASNGFCYCGERKDNG